MTTSPGDRAPEALTATVAALLALLVTAVAALSVAGVATLVGAGPGTVQVLLLVVAALGLVGTLAVGATAWLTVRWTRAAVRSAGRRLRRWSLDRVRTVERAVPPTQRLRLASFVVPDEEAELADLKRRYVRGELDEAAFERRVAQVVGDDRTAKRLAERADAGAEETGDNAGVAGTEAAGGDAAVAERGANSGREDDRDRERGTSTGA
jgi:hypothetical protein